MTESLRDKPGVLLILADVPSSVEKEYERWWDEEHIPQRLECPRVRSARRWVAVEGQPRHLTFFELDAVSALDTEEYIHLSKNPTDRTTAIVVQIKIERLVYAERCATGTELAPDEVGALMLVTFDLPSDLRREYEDWYRGHDAELVQVPGVLRVRRYAAAEAGPAHCVVIEFADAAVVQSDAYRAARSDPGRERLAAHFDGFRRNLYLSQ